MSNLDLVNLGRKMLHGGIAPKYVRRTLSELNSHFEDIKEQATKTGASELEAELLARKQIGDENVILQEALSKPELKSLAWRFPKTVLLLGPILIYLISTAVFAISLITLFSLFPALTSLETGSSPSTIVKMSLEILIFFFLYLAPLCIAVFIALYVKAHGIKNYLPVFGILMMVIIGSGWAYELVWPTASSRGEISMNWGYSYLPRYIRGDHDIQNYAQILLALCLAFVSWKVYTPNELNSLLDNKPADSHD